MNETQQELWGMVETINQAWTAGRTQMIGLHLHEDMVVHGHARGRDAVVASYRQFAEGATIQRFETGDPDVEIVGDTGVVSYEFLIEYEMEGEAIAEGGEEVWVFSRIEGTWKAIWRAMMLAPEEEG